MEFAFSAEQEQFRDSLARFLKDKSPPRAVRRLMATAEGFDADVWRQACGEVGLAGLHLPEAYGGAGYGPVELGIAMEEQGRTLKPSAAAAAVGTRAKLAGVASRPPVSVEKICPKPIFVKSSEENTSLLL